MDKFPKALDLFLFSKKPLELVRLRKLQQAMLWTIIVILVVLWLLGFSVFHVAGGLIHILLVIAVVVLVVKLVTGRGV
jgi:Family of unknown function (DUF5670)